MTFIYVRRSQWFCVVIMFTAFLLSWIWYDFWLRGTRARDFQPVWPIIFLLHYIIDLPPSWLCQPLVIFTSKVCFPNTKSIITHGESNKESFQQNNLTPRCPLVVGEVCVHHITKPFFFDHINGWWVNVSEKRKCFYWRNNILIPRAESARVQRFVR